MAVWAQSEQGFTLNVTRVYCSAVCIFHRRGLPELALQAVEALRARNAEVPPFGCQWHGAKCLMAKSSFPMSWPMSLAGS